MMCQSMGFPPTSTMGFGREEVSSAILVPKPPANMTAFIISLKTKKFIIQNVKIYWNFYKAAGLINIYFEYFLNKCQIKIIINKKFSTGLNMVISDKKIGGSRIIKPPLK